MPIYIGFVEAALDKNYILAYRWEFEKLLEASRTDEVRELNYSCFVFGTRHLPKKLKEPTPLKEGQRLKAYAQHLHSYCNPYRDDLLGKSSELENLIEVGFQLEDRHEGLHFQPLTIPDGTILEVTDLLLAEYGANRRCTEGWNVPRSNHFLIEVNQTPNAINPKKYDGLLMRCAEDTADLPKPYFEGLPKNPFMHHTAECLKDSSYRTLIREINSQLVYTVLKVGSRKGNANNS